LPHRADTRLQLDLSPSLPYTLVSLRSHLLSQLAELEARVRSLYPAADGPSLAASFLAQASALRNDVRRLGTFLPRVPAALTLPQVPSLPAAPTWDMAELAAAWETLSFQLPSGGGDMLASLRARFEGCQDAYAALTLPDFFGASTRAAFDEGMMSPAAAHFEALVAKVKATGEDVRAKGHARASSVAKAARDAEDRLYQAALELAGQGQKLIRYEHLPELWKNNSHIVSAAQNSAPAAALITLLAAVRLPLHPQVEPLCAAALHVPDPQRDGQHPLAPARRHHHPAALLAE
jgi:adiponectin receptor